MVGRTIFPTSGEGTLYKKELLYKDMTHEKLFMTLAPTADDVWNYFMGYLQGTENVVLPYKGYIYIPLDAIYQHFHQGANLSQQNCGLLQNDKQIRQIMNYYHIADNMIFELKNNEREWL